MFYPRLWCHNIANVTHKVLHSLMLMSRGHCCISGLTRHEGDSFNISLISQILFQVSQEPTFVCLVFKEVPWLLESLCSCSHCLLGYSVRIWSSCVKLQISNSFINVRYNILTYVDAVTQEQPPRHEDLLAAYRIAGSKFQGRLKKLFLVRDDDMALKIQAKGHGGKSGSGKNKRRASTDGSSQKKRLPSTQ